MSDTQRSLSEWLEEAGNTLFDRGIEYGDPRSNFLRIYKIARALGIQLRDPSELALIAIATKLSRMICIVGFLADNLFNVSNIVLNQVIY